MLSFAQHPGQSLQRLRDDRFALDADDARAVVDHVMRARDPACLERQGCISPQDFIPSLPGEVAPTCLLSWNRWGVTIRCMS